MHTLVPNEKVSLMPFLVLCRYFKEYSHCIYLYTNDGRLWARNDLVTVSLLLHYIKKLKNKTIRSCVCLCVGVVLEVVCFRQPTLMKL